MFDAFGVAVVLGQAGLRGAATGGMAAWLHGARSARPNDVDFCVDLGEDATLIPLLEQVLATLQMNVRSDWIVDRLRSGRPVRVAGETGAGVDLFPRVPTAIGFESYERLVQRTLIDPGTGLRFVGLGDAIAGKMLSLALPGEDRVERAELTLAELVGLARKRPESVNIPSIYGLHVRERQLDSQFQGEWRQSLRELVFSTLQERAQRRGQSLTFNPLTPPPLLRPAGAPFSASTERPQRIPGGARQRERPPGAAGF